MFRNFVINMSWLAHLCCQWPKDAPIHGRLSEDADTREERNIHNTARRFGQAPEANSPTIVAFPSDTIHPFSGENPLLTPFNLRSFDLTLTPDIVIVDY